jgi:hypothetical protein
MTLSPRNRDQLVWLVTVVLAGLGALAWWQAPTLPQLGSITASSTIRSETDGCA